MNCDLRLARHGLFLIVLGLLSGFATLAVVAPRMALAAHTIGIVQGSLAIGLAFLWPVLVQAGFPLPWCRVAILVGFYANWAGALLASVWSAKAMMAVHGEAMPDLASSAQEVLVAVLLNVSMLSLAGLIWVAVVLGKILKNEPSPS